MKTPANPFILGKYVSSKYFCDRNEETEQLRKHIANGRNVTLISPRRMGKTGLIRHFFSQDDVREKYSTVFIDIYATRSLTEFAYLFSNAVYASVKGNLLTQIQQFFKAVSSLSVGLKFDAITGDPTLDLQMGHITSPYDTIKQLFDYLESMPKPVIVAIDEFQQIGEYAEKNTEALLRTMIQDCSNTHFIFAGSKRHVIANMFNSPAKPFYQSTFLMGLEAIPCDTYTAFAVDLFKAYSKDVTTETVEAAYKQGKGVTWYVQAIMNELFADTATAETCAIDSIPKALRNIIAANSGNYLETFANLSERQKQVLIAIARAGEVAEISSTQFITANSLGSASIVQSAMRALLKHDIVTKENATYRVSDIFFGQWVAQY